MKRNRFLRVLKVVAIGVIGVTIVGQLISHLWNWLTPELFGWHTINFWQALGLFVLSRFFFGGFRGRGFGGRRMRARWEQMTPEQREQFKQGMRSRGRCEKFEGPAPEPTA
jgi:hypothetical protein